jgi:hypothetical protein
VCAPAPFSTPPGAPSRPLHIAVGSVGSKRLGLVVGGVEDSGAGALAVPFTWTVEVAIPRGTGSAFVTHASRVVGKGVRTLPGVSGQVFDVEVVGLNPGTPYCLRVRAVSTAGTSDPGSSAHCFCTHQGPPYSVVVAHRSPRFSHGGCCIAEGRDFAHTPWCP